MPTRVGCTAIASPARGEPRGWSGSAAQVRKQALAVRRRARLDLEFPQQPPHKVSLRRRLRLNANLIFMWLKDPRFEPIAAVEEKPVFLPVEVREDDAPTVPMASPTGGALGRVAIVLATGHRISIDGPFDGDAVARLLRVLTQP